MLVARTYESYLVNVHNRLDGKSLGLSKSVEISKLGPEMRSWQPNSHLYLILAGFLFVLSAFRRIQIHWQIMKFREQYKVDVVN